MFLNGILAIFQILLLPGMILRLVFKPKGGFFFQLSVVVSLSMLTNTTLIYPLVLLHLYSRIVFITLIFIEIVLIIWLYRGIYRINLNEQSERIFTYTSNCLDSIKDIFKNGDYSRFVQNSKGVILLVLGTISLSLVYWFFRKIPNNIGSVFYEWDAVVSWNNWAQVWAQNMVPEIHLTYPQLLPLNLSITYLLTGNYEVSLFAKSIMPIFALLTILVVFELGVSQKKYGIIAATIIIYLLYKKFLGDIIADGYADVPLAFFAFISLKPYLEDLDFYSDKKNYILCLLIAAAAALTKQAGLVVLVFLPLAGLINNQVRNKRLIRQILLWFGLSVLLILPWYLPIGIRVLQNSQLSGINTYITLSAATQASDSPVLRLGNAFRNLGKYISIFIFLIPAFFLVNRQYKLLILIFIIPLSIFWAIVASYDARNLSITFTFLAIITGLGLERILEFIFRIIDRLKFHKIRSVVLLLCLIIPIGFFSLRLDDSEIISKWETEQNDIFSPEINSQLRALDNSNPICKKILTNYPVDFLPGMKGMQVNTYFDDYGYFQMQIQDPEICWILVPNYAISEVQNFIDEKVLSGKFQILFTSENWVPYELIQIR